MSDFPKENYLNFIPMNGSKTNQAPLFCVHSITGIGSSEYLALAREINNREVYAINSNDEKISESISEIASRYIRQIKSKQCNGPYAICGYSFGGLIAYEITQQLEKSGEEVELTLIDTTYSQMKSWDNSVFAKHLLSILQIIVNQYSNIEVSFLSLDALVKYESKEDIIKAIFADIDLKATQENDYLAKSSLSDLNRIFSTIQKHALAALNYEITGTVNHINLFIADTLTYINNKKFETIINDEKSINNWSNHCTKKINTYNINANHFQIISDNNFLTHYKELLNNRKESPQSNLFTFESNNSLLNTFNYKKRSSKEFLKTKNTSVDANNYFTTTFTTSAVTSQNALPNNFFFLSTNTQENNQKEEFSDGYSSTPPSTSILSSIQGSPKRKKKRYIKTEESREETNSPNTNTQINYNNLNY